MSEQQKMQEKQRNAVIALVAGIVFLVLGLLGFADTDSQLGGVAVPVLLGGGVLTVVGVLGYRR